MQAEFFLQFYKIIKIVFSPFSIGDSWKVCKRKKCLYGKKYEMVCFVNLSLRKKWFLKKICILRVDKTVKNEYNATVGCRKYIVKLLERLLSN